jgi:hypothetical protein
MMMAAGLGMKVSKPFGDLGRYDVGVEEAAGVVRVQVKSTIYTRRNGGYSLNVMGPQRAKYEPGTVDFFAILLIPRDEWYVIPFEVMGRTNCSLHFTPSAQRQKYGEYREAWHLLRETGLTIQACGDEEWEGRVLWLDAAVESQPSTALRAGFLAKEAKSGTLVRSGGGESELSFARSGRTRASVPTWVVAAAGRQQVPRLRKIIRFADDLSPLGMTKF